MHGHAGTARVVLHVMALLTCVSATSAHAASPWDGLWDLDEAKSHWATHSFVVVELPNDKWQYGDGAGATVFAMDGKPHAEPNAPDFTMTATLVGSNVLELVESGYGRDTERDRFTLASDGQSLAVDATRVYPDGREVGSTTSYLRVAGAAGFAGKWKETPAAEAAAPAPSAPSALGSTAPARPYWVISTAPDGTMSWFIPATGELIRGKADGVSRPLIGPQQPAGRTFVWKQASPQQIEFYVSDRGQLIERATETLSADGTTFTDTLWSPEHEDEKDVRVFVKR